MSIKTLTINFNEEEQRRVNLYMEFQDRPLSLLVKELLLEDVNDFFDSLSIKDSEKYNISNPQKYTSNQLLKELDLDLI